MKLGRPEWLFLALLSVAAAGGTWAQDKNAADLKHEIEQLVAKGSVTEAIPLAEEAAELSKKEHGSEDLNYAAALDQLADLYQKARRYDDERSITLEATQIRRSKLSEADTESMKVLSSKLEHHDD